MKTNEEIIAEIIRQVPLASCGINLQEVAIQTAKAVLEYKDKELKEFLETISLIFIMVRDAGLYQKKKYG